MEAKVLIWMVCLAVAGLALSGTPAAAGLLAGEARVSITPSLAQFPTISLGGFGDRLGKPAQSVHDDIYCRALVLSDGSTKLALVATDLLVIAPGMKEAVLAKLQGLGFDQGNLLLAAAHNHSSPECLHPGGDVWPLAFGKFHPQFYEWMNCRLAEAVRAAHARLQPAQLGFASAPLAGFNRNRRSTGGGLIDPTLTVMKVATREAKPHLLALVVNFTAHPTMLGGDSFIISGEWPGAMARALEARLGGGSALFFNGTQGDQTTSGSFGSGLERVNNYGKALAERVWQLARGVKMASPVRLAASSVLWELPPYEVSPAFIESTGEEYQMTPEGARQLFSQLFPAQVRLQALRVGDGVFMAVPGEAIVELGLAMKKDARAAGARYPAAVGLANSYIGYILSPDQYRLGGYESGTSFYGPELGSRLVAEMGRTVQPLFAKGRP